MQSQPVTKRNDVHWTEAHHNPAGVWCGFEEKTTELPKGWVKEPGRRPFACDTIWQKDIAVPTRDGTVLRADVFRPANADSLLPCIMIWSPFGKAGNGLLSLDLIKYRAGVAKNATSGLENWEAPDPADWCARGYVIVNVTARGCFDSEGDFVVYGTQEGQDGHDAVEWIAQQEWSSGNIGMAGNSWLTSTQWFIAAEKPPHLKAIAPWEGLGDYYRQSICRGGIPDSTFWETLFSLFGGKNRREDVTAMVHARPFIDDYWLDKKPNLENISIPMYATLSYSTLLHTEGSFRGFFFSNSQQKWLRIHDTQEWHDIYQPEYLDEMQSFFDYFLKDNLDNGWDKTPQMRLSLLGYNLPNVVARPITTYPPKNVEHRLLYLDAANASLTENATQTRASTTYDSTQRNNARMDKLVGAAFTHRFHRYTELIGWSKVTLYMSTEDTDDMDVYVVLRKLDANGQALQSYNIPFVDLPAGTTTEDLPWENVFRYIGPSGRLRASHRAVGVEPGLTEEQRAQLGPAAVWHPHDKAEPVEKDKVYKLEIGIWPGGMVFEQDEYLRLEIKGCHPVMPEFEPLLDQMKYYNVGSHKIHTGADCPSSLLVPLSEERVESRLRKILP